MWQTVKNYIRDFFALGLTVLFCVGVLLQNAYVLRGLPGERTFYVHSASSQASIQSDLQFKDAFFMTGESVYLTEQADVDALVERFQAEIVFVECVGDTVSYYGFSPNLPYGVALFGTRVNLHIALSPRGCVVGTPIIFGGY